MAESNLSSTTLDEIQNHEDFKVVWLSLDDNVPNELTHFVDYLEKCHSIATCKSYIEGFKSERKILLVLVNLFESVSDFNDLPQIQSIYLLKQNSEHVKERYSKLVSVYTDEHMLIERLRNDILLTYRNDFSINISCLNEITIEQSLMSLEKNTFTFIWNQLFINHLVNSPNVDMNKLKRDMVEQCRLEYRDNKSQLKHIDEFNENCTEDNILDWYTSSSFAFRLVNRAFRTRNIDLICKFRYFIILLYNKLKQLAIQQQQQQTEGSKTVYRGQNLGKNDLENLRTNVGHLISVNTFMSTSRDRNVADIFRGEDELSVLFEINITNASHNILHPFADISQFSSNTDEEEILFSAGAVFRVDSVEQGNDSTWIIKLILSNESVQQIERILDGLIEQLSYIKHWDHGFMKVNDLRMFRDYYKILTDNSFSLKNLITDVFEIDFYYLMSVVGDHEKMIEYYKDLLFNEKFIDHPKSIVVNILIGYNYFYLLEYDNALFYYDVALSSLDERNELKGEIYSHIADVWRVRNIYETALLYYEKALEIFMMNQDGGRASARTCRKISNIYLDQNRYDEAIIYEEQANEIDQMLRQRSELDVETSLAYFQNQLNIPSDHPEIHRAETLYSMGLCLIKTNDFSQALETFSEAKSLFEKHSPWSRGLAHKFAELYESIAVVHLCLKDNLNALIMLKKAIDIRLIYCRE